MIHSGMFVPHDIVKKMRGIESYVPIVEIAYGPFWY